jgi:hypothetical protein
VLASVNVETLSGKGEKYEIYTGGRGGVVNRVAGGLQFNR